MYVAAVKKTQNCMGQSRVAEGGVPMPLGTVAATNSELTALAEPLFCRMFLTSAPPTTLCTASFPVQIKNIIYQLLEELHTTQSGRQMLHILQHSISMQRS